MDRLAMIMTNSNSIQDVLFFPQMKPEAIQEKKVELSDNERLIFNELSKHGTMPLGDLKTAVNLSNKQWDKSVKALAKYELTKVTKIDDQLLIAIL